MSNKLKYESIHYEKILNTRRNHTMPFTTRVAIQYKSRNLVNFIIDEKSVQLYNIGKGAGIT